MTPQLKALAEKMAEEYANNIQLGYGHGIAENAFLAGFEARDGMDARLREEHAEMLEVLKGVIPHIEWMGRKKLTPANFNVVQHIKKVISKIESK